MWTWRASSGPPEVGRDRPGNRQDRSHRQTQDEKEEQHRRPWPEMAENPRKGKTLRPRRVGLGRVRPIPCSAELDSAVSQNWILRTVAGSDGPGIPRVLSNAIRRYSRLKTCAPPVLIPGRLELPHLGGCTVQGMLMVCLELMGRFADGSGFQIVQDLWEQRLAVFTARGHFVGSKDGSAAIASRKGAAVVSNSSIAFSAASPHTSAGAPHWPDRATRSGRPERPPAAVPAERLCRGPPARLASHPATPAATAVAGPRRPTVRGSGCPWRPVAHRAVTVAKQLLQSRKRVGLAAEAKSAAAMISFSG